MRSERFEKLLKEFLGQKETQELLRSRGLDDSALSCFQFSEGTKGEDLESDGAFLPDYKEIRLDREFVQKADDRQIFDILFHELVHAFQTLSGEKNEVSVRVPTLDSSELDAVVEDLNRKRDKGYSESDVLHYLQKRYEEEPISQRKLKKLRDESLHAMKKKAEYQPFVIHTGDFSLTVGVDPEAIKLYEKDPDGLQRRIDRIGSAIKEVAKTIADRFGDPENEEAYRKMMESLDWYIEGPSDTYSAEYHPVFDSVSVPINSLESYNYRNFLQTLIHEMEHRFQAETGMIPKTRKEFKKFIDRYRAQPWAENPEEYGALVQEIRTLLDKGYSPDVLIDRAPEGQKEIMKSVLEIAMNIDPQGLVSMSKTEGIEKKANDAARDYSCVLAPMPKDLADLVRKYGESIPDEDIYDPPDDDKYGRELQPHVTVLYGLHTQDPKEVEKILSETGPIEISLGGFSLFSIEEKDYDVLKIDVSSKDLTHLHDLLKDSLKNTDSFPEYKPHVTVAYLKRGKGKDYADGSAWAEERKKDIADKKEVLDQIQFSDKDSKKTEISLKEMKTSSLESLLGSMPEADVDSNTDDDSKSLSEPEVTRNQPGDRPGIPNAQVAKHQVPEGLHEPTVISAPLFLCYRFLSENTPESLLLARENALEFITRLQYGLSVIIPLAYRRDESVLKDLYEYLTEIAQHTMVSSQDFESNMDSLRYGLINLLARYGYLDTKLGYLSRQLKELSYFDKTASFLKRDELYGSEVVTLSNLPEGFEGPEGDFYIGVKHNNEIVSAASITETESSLYLEWIKTLATHEGEGHASEIVESLKSHRKSIYTDPTNPRAVSLFERLGFRPTGRKRIPEGLKSSVSSGTYAWYPDKIASKPTPLPPPVNTMKKGYSYLISPDGNMYEVTDEALRMHSEFINEYIGEGPAGERMADTIHRALRLGWVRAGRENGFTYFQALTPKYLRHQIVDDSATYEDSIVLEVGDYNIEMRTKEWLESGQSLADFAAEYPNMRIRAADRFNSIIEKIIASANKLGVNVYAVGGFVRDELIGRKAKDLDVMVEGKDGGIKLAKQISEDYGLHEPIIFPTFGTARLNIDGEEVEFVAPRREHYDPNSRKPETQFTSSLEEDAKRRDFTVNSLFKNLKTGEVLDLTGLGKADLEKKIIRVSDPENADVIFSEDPLRMLRAIRQSLALGFEIEPETLKAIARNASRLGVISSERIRDEFMKIITGSGASKGMRMLHDLGLTKEFFPEWEEAVKTDQETFYHDKTVADHILAAVDNVSEDLVDRLSALLHDIGKPAAKTIVDEVAHFYKHEDIGAELAETILRRLKFPNDIIEAVKSAVQYHMRPHLHTKDWADKSVRRFMRDVGPHLERVLRIAEADIKGGAPHGQEERLKELEEFKSRIEKEKTRGPEPAKIEPLLDGNELQQLFGKGPGPWIGKAHEFLIEKQLENPDLSKEEATELVKQFIATENEPKKADLIRNDMEKSKEPIYGNPTKTTSSPVGADGKVSGLSVSESVCGDLGIGKSNASEIGSSSKEDSRIKKGKEANIKTADLPFKYFGPADQTTKEQVLTPGEMTENEEELFTRVQNPEYALPLTKLPVEYVPERPRKPTPHVRLEDVLEEIKSELDPMLDSNIIMHVDEGCEKSPSKNYPNEWRSRRPNTGVGLPDVLKSLKEEEHGKEKERPNP